MKTTKVRFEVTLEVDVNDWNLNYGTETVRQVQADVRQYLLTLLADTQGGLEFLTVVQR